MNQFLGMSLSELEASLEPDPSAEEDTVKMTDDELQDILERASVLPDPPSENLPIG